MIMAKKIIEMVFDRKLQMRRSQPEAKINQTLAIAAILGGIKSPDWETYMRQFVEKDAAGLPLDPDQLKRLLATDTSAGNADQDLHRAYLVGNGVCGPFSPDTL